MRIRDFALNRIKDYITSGAVGPGQRLPSERELAEELGIGRNSLREALKVLEAVGLVESRVGDGTYITDQAAASIGRTLGMALAVWGGAIVEIIEARRMIEVSAAPVAAEKATASDLAALETALNRMDAMRREDVRGYFAADMEFHRVVARATQNAIVSRIVGDLIDLLERVLHQASVDQLPMIEEGSGTHRAVYDAIVRRDPAAAASAMRDHLQFSTELWKAVVSLVAAGRPGGTP
jgi:GntR family transcriptional repressor for pyruvate dehydrogenase complex